MCHEIHWEKVQPFNYNDVVMDWMASQITSLMIIYSTNYSGADQRKYQSSASLAFVRGIHRWPANSPHKWPVTRKMFPFDDVTMLNNVGQSKKKTCLKLLAIAALKKTRVSLGILHCAWGRARSFRSSDITLTYPSPIIHVQDHILHIYIWNHGISFDINHKTKYSNAMCKFIRYAVK